MNSIYKFFLSVAGAIFYLTLSSTSITAQTAKKATAAEIAEGKVLISKSDCLACHKTDAKLLGPSYKDVAKKYAAIEANYNLLSQKVIKGGSGVWGSIPMAPHASLKPEEAKKMIKYILSIK
ncbi:c-type cytochrome [Flavobacterium algicola]|uniref:c-type cytochrome n=1 Tax=Flavobacterium algicola TaxID=556529 RepID=UPI001EFDA436|nr:c-type cytochrome [Flavobacterium algicola]MCG9792256.1 c-type cytochrome [Flavobacterium algicola]